MPLWCIDTGIICFLYRILRASPRNHRELNDMLYKRRREVIMSRIDWNQAMER